VGCKSPASPDAHGGTVTQVTLPGQAFTAEGPHDQTGMYVMHHAFRRDLDRFVAATRATPVDEAAVWAALEDRWSRFDGVLHHHHHIEDEAFWPVLLTHATDERERSVLVAMEAEHATIDPALVGCRSAFATMRRDPSDEHRHALFLLVTALRDALFEHLRHEEREALPLLQRTVSADEYAVMEGAAKKGYPLRTVPFLVPWALLDLPDDARDRLLRAAGPIYGLVHRLARRGFDRREALAFRYA
jgi:hypothetical protein